MRGPEEDRLAARNAAKIESRVSQALVVVRPSAILQKTAAAAVFRWTNRRRSLLPTLLGARAASICMLNHDRYTGPGARSLAPIGPASPPQFVRQLSVPGNLFRNGLRTIPFRELKVVVAVNAPLLLSHHRKVPVSGRSRNGASTPWRCLEGSSVADPRHRSVAAAGGELKPRVKADGRLLYRISITGEEG